MTEQGPHGRPSLKYQLAGTGAQRAGHLPVPATNGPRVLVVDDDPDMARLISAALSSMGVTPLAAYDALQGMVVAQRESPSVIIVDLHMPAGGGLKLLEKLKASARTAEIPVLVITADTAADLPRRAQELGARGFLRKPVDLVRLLEVVSPFLGIAPDPANRSSPA
jgi:two-component system, chemotaxis family, chemotaxis protein CheY